MKHFPSKQAILEWVRDNPTQSNKRDIARAFGIKGQARVDLKRILRELYAEGHLSKDRKTYRDKDSLAPIELLHIVAKDSDGDLIAEPLNWKGDGDAPKVLFIAKKGDPALTTGDRILCRIEKTNDEYAFTARLIRRIGRGAEKIIGIYSSADFGGRILPVDKKSDREYQVDPANRNGARDGELVEAEQFGGRSKGLNRAKILARLGDPSAAKSVSLIAIHQHGIPDHFPAEVLEEAAKAKPVKLAKREDLRHLPLFTIDPPDARDRDDAICAMPDPDNKNGHIVWVAIADVAHYVRPGTALDREAYKRGNSSYFPDRVVPMLPDNLSGDLCSLHGGVDRPCLALCITLDENGQKTGHRFTRGLMRSPAALSYLQAQQAVDGAPDDVTAPILENGIKPLWAAYASAKKARNIRQPLHLDLPERQIILSDAGAVTSVAFRDRFDAHKLVEEFMVLANVCAAETLEAKKSDLIYRVHEDPNPEKLAALHEVVQSVGMVLAKGQKLKTAQLNKLLDAAAGGEYAEMINMTVLRSMTQAYYSPQNMGHFGLNLKRYAHFTSPIRRYADLIVHRALIAAHGWGDDGLTAVDAENLEKIAEHISQTERRSMLAERDTTDRYLSAFLSEQVGSDFAGVVSGVARFGIFVKLDDTGADGLIPVSRLGREYFTFDEDSRTLTGEHSKRVLRSGLRAKVRLTEADPLTGGLMFELLEVDGKPLPSGQKGKGRKSTPRGKARSKIKRSRIAKKKKRS